MREAADASALSAGILGFPVSKTSGEPALLSDDFCDSCACNPNTKTNNEQHKNFRTIHPFSYFD
jgi:hypothetical protein